MVKTMFDISHPSISQDQSLALQSEILDFIRSAIGVDKGYEVLEIADLETFEFCHYYSDGSKIDARPDETRDETIDRVLFTIDCAQLKKIKDDREELNHVMSLIYDYAVGAISSWLLRENFNIEDYTNVLRENTP